MQDNIPIRRIGNKYNVRAAIQKTKTDCILPELNLPTKDEAKEGKTLSTEFHADVGETTSHKQADHLKSK